MKFYPITNKIYIIFNGNLANHKKTFYSLNLFKLHTYSNLLCRYLSANPNFIASKTIFTLQNLLHKSNLNSMFVFKFREVHLLLSSCIYRGSYSARFPGRLEQIIPA